MIEVEHLTRVFRTYKKQPGFWGGVKGLFHRQFDEVAAANDISFSIKEGEFVGFLGPNGAGKTTTLKMLSGLIYPTSAGPASPATIRRSAPPPTAGSSRSYSARKTSSGGICPPSSHSISCATSTDSTAPIIAKPSTNSSISWACAKNSPRRCASSRSANA